MGDRPGDEEPGTYEWFRRALVSAYEEADRNLSNCGDDHAFAKCQQRMATLCGMVDAGSIKADVANERLTGLVVEAN